MPDRNLATEVLEEYVQVAKQAGHTFGVASTDDIGFKFRGKFVSLQKQIERQRLSEMLSVFALIISFGVLIVLYVK